MKKSNLIRKFSITAFLILGVLTFGAESRVFADGGGTIGSGTRSSGGYLGSGNRTEEPAPPVTEGESALQVYIDAFYEFIF